MIIQTIKVLTETLENIRRKKTINFIPTMGNLHEGHLSLIKKSQKKDYVSLVSIFVNPLQFSEKNDFKNYPRTLKKDLELLKKHNVDLIFLPKSFEGEFVFCNLKDKTLNDVLELNPLSSYREDEGLSLLLSREQAEGAGIKYDSVFRGITLSVHSSLDAVGLTAAVSNKLAANGIPANMIAAHFHDHVFVPAGKAELALQLLTELKA